MTLCFSEVLLDPGFAPAADALALDIAAACFVAELLA